ncbi:hypothetical protein KY358_06710 [Candidatus Woesearchaeota archaeon]|nr:hypothetical protein [Candidatus Woesearchaeota archaeon]
MDAEEFALFKKDLDGKERITEKDFIALQRVLMKQYFDGFLEGIEKYPMSSEYDSDDEFMTMILYSSEHKWIPESTQRGGYKFKFTVELRGRIFKDSPDKREPISSMEMYGIFGLKEIGLDFPPFLTIESSLDLNHIIDITPGNPTVSNLTVPDYIENYKGKKIAIGMDGIFKELVNNTTIYSKNR